MHAISSAGAQAGQVQLSGRLLLQEAALHQAIGQGFVDTDALKLVPTPCSVLHQAIGQAIVDAKERGYRDRQSR